jgi:cobyrinic acid a,c-diamide synthase
MNSCSAILVSAPASGQGKTSVTAGLARLHARQGRRVRVFKTGPDFLDPSLLQQASGQPVYNLDLWMGGEAHCRQLLYEAARDADLILVEGVMGLFDGTPSSADLAALFGIPVMAVIDASAMAQSFAALVHGLATFRPDLPFFGALANRVAGRSHEEMLQELLPPRTPFLGPLPQDADLAFPERHLGLHRAGEIADVERRLDTLADRLEATACARLPPPVQFEAPGQTPGLPPLLQGKTIAIARDEAFSFLYPANLDTLEALGAELAFFSPLTDTALPEADAVWLPGGYPELHLEALSGNRAMREALHFHHRAGKPILAECGGLLYLLDSLTDQAGNQADMTGLLPGRGVLQESLANLGLQSMDLPEGELRGHSFHHGRLEMPFPPAAYTRTARHHGQTEGIWREGRMTASFLHGYFPSNPAAVAGLFAA